jgi:hypothetical protein
MLVYWGRYVLRASSSSCVTYNTRVFPVASRKGRGGGGKEDRKQVRKEEGEKRNKGARLREKGRGVS